MASSRQIRGRRLPSPMKNAAPQPHPTFKKDVQAEPVNGRSSNEKWEEPALRAPAPSFEDYKGLERHGVLEHMAPLGHLPGQKLKAKMRYQEMGPRSKAVQAKNEDSRNARDEVNTPEPAQAASSSQQSDYRRQSTSGSALQTREGDDDGDYEPRRATKKTLIGSAAPLSSQPAANGTSAARQVPEGNDKMREVVVKAAKRANDTGNPLLGHAIQHMYEESFHSEEVADLLAAVLAQKQTPEQTTAFQLYIKAAKKAIKHSKGDPAKSASISNLALQSPGKNGRTSVTRQSRTLNDTGAPGLNHLPPLINHATTTKPGFNSSMISNGSPSIEDRPAKRLKRTDSAESGSSDLSSVDSQIEDLIPEAGSSSLHTSASNHLPPQRAFQTGTKSNLGPRLGPSKKKRQLDPNRQSGVDLVQQSSDTAADDLYAANRRKLLEEQAFDDYNPTESRIRPIPRELRRTSTITPAHTPPPQKSLQPQSRLRNGTAQRNKRYDDDDDALSSPPSSPGDLLIPPPAGASRGGTPNNLRRNLKPIKRAKVKNSPIKKQKNVTAGVARLVDSDPTYFGIRRADDSHDHENSDFCAACSGGGKLLCCDGCERAFHFSCLQPPMDPDTQPEGQWLCIRCLKNRLEFPSQPRGVFRELSAEVNGRNPSAFNLPLAVRDYFDGVKTGEEGEYEETASVNAKKGHGGGYEENPNNLKLRDGKDNAILCFRCGKSAMGKNGFAAREIIGCDFCTCSWHLDCLDPPLASAPNRRSTNGKPRHTWMCPAHVDDELSHLDPSVQRSSTSAKVIRAPTGRSYRIRRPKNPNIIDIGLRRGFRNNGLIEIDSESSSEDDEILKELSNSTVRAPEKGIKLDFIDRVNRMNSEEANMKQKAHYLDSTTQTVVGPSPKSATLTKLDGLPFAERKVALNLAQFAQGQPDITLSSDQVRNLIQILTAEAPEEVERLIAESEQGAEKKIADDSLKAEATPGAVSLNDQEKNDLASLIKLAQRRLESIST